MREQCKEAECRADKVHTKLYREVQDQGAQLASLRSENTQLKSSLKAAQVRPTHMLAEAFRWY
jgi:archaeosine-15-forming tRNA-guanine transglycosylase